MPRYWNECACLKLCCWTFPETSVYLSLMSTDWVLTTSYHVSTLYKCYCATPLSELFWRNISYYSTWYTWRVEILSLLYNSHIFGRFFSFNVYVLSLLIGFDLKSVSLDIEISTPAFFLVPFSLSTTFSSICPKPMSVLGGEVCFLATAEKWILFSKSVFYSIYSYWGLEIFNIVINGPCLLIPVILLPLWGFPFFW